jgi:magnesium-transporting ATPase (P-type)
MRLIEKKYHIPEFTIILLSHLFPLVAVLQGELPFISLVLVYFFEQIAIIFIDYFKLNGAPFDNSLIVDYKMDITSPDFKKEYLQTIKTGYIVSYSILFFVLSILMSIPVYSFLESEQFQNQSLSTIFSNNWIWYALAVSIAAQLVSLWYYYESSIQMRKSAEAITKVDTKQYVMLQMILIFSVLFGVQSYNDDTYAYNYAAIVYAVGITTVKMYVTTKQYQTKFKSSNE